MKNNFVLYRHYSHSSELLYIGISSQLINRTLQHHGSKWFKDISIIKIEHFENKESALSAEKYAIQNEKPKYNIFHLEKIKKEIKKKEVIIKPYETWYGWDKRKYKKLTAEQIELIKLDVRDFYDMGRHYNIYNYMVEYIRGYELENEIQEKKYKEKIAKYEINEMKKKNAAMKLLGIEA